MKRRLLIIAIFLLLGAVVNVAVAWGCAAFVPGTGSGSRVGLDDPRARDMVGSKSPYMVVAAVSERSGYGHDSLFVAGWTVSSPKSGDPSPKAGDVVGVMEWSSVYGHDRLRRTGRTSWRAESQHTTRAGLPLRCLVGRFNWASTGGPSRARTSEEYVGAWPVPLRQVGPSGLKGRSFLPLRPTWPGFALNTLFYAALLWLLIPGPFALRRFLRVRRGLCPKCAYPMGESAVCSECGASFVSPVSSCVAGRYNTR